MKLGNMRANTRGPVRWASPTILPLVILTVLLWMALGVSALFLAFLLLRYQ